MEQTAYAEEMVEEPEITTGLLEENISILKPEVTYEPYAFNALDDLNAYSNVDFPYYQGAYMNEAINPESYTQRQLNAPIKKKKKKRSFWGNVRKGFKDFNKVYRKVVPKEVRNFGNAVIPGASLVDDMCSGIGQLGSNPKKFAKRFTSEDWWFQATMTGIGEGFKYAFFGVPAVAGYVGGRVGGELGKELGGAKGEMWGGIVGGTLGYAGGAAQQGAKFSAALGQSAALTATIQGTTYAGQKIGEETMGGYEGAAVGASFGQLVGTGIALRYGGPRSFKTKTTHNGVTLTAKTPMV